VRHCRIVFERQESRAAPRRAALGNAHHHDGSPKLPLNLLDALREFDKDEGHKSAMGTEFSAAYLKLKQQEWSAYSSHFTRWERETTLDI
jgi:glutamine synthetase